MESVAHQELAFNMAVKSFVLLKNIDRTMPVTLSASATNAQRKLCVFGARANITAIGSYANQGVLARYNQTMLGALQARFGKDNVVYSTGCAAGREACPLLCTAPDTAAIRAALTQCSASIVVTGTITNGEAGKPASCSAHSSIYYEAEGSDRPDATLAAEALLKSVATAAQALPQPHKVVLMLANAGSVELGWPKASTSVGAILHSSFPGQAAGQAFGAIISGDSVPAGRLALTYYDGLTDSLPSISNYSMVNRTYRYLTPNVPVAYSFGFGLSAWGDGFHYSDVKVSPAGPIQISPDMAVTLTFTVENNGDVTSDEVAQLYLHTETTSGPHTLRPELKGFTRIFAVKPHEKRKVALSVGWRELSVLRGNDLKRVVEASARNVFIGGGQPHEFVGGVSANFSTVYIGDSGA